MLPWVCVVWGMPRENLSLTVCTIEMIMLSSALHHVLVLHSSACLHHARLVGKQLCRVSAAVCGLWLLRCVLGCMAPLYTAVRHNVALRGLVICWASLVCCKGKAPVLDIPAFSAEPRPSTCMTEAFLPSRGGDGVLLLSCSWRSLTASLCVRH